MPRSLKKLQMKKCSFVDHYTQKKLDMDEEVIAPIQKYLKGETWLTMMYQAYKLYYHYLAQIVKSQMKAGDCDDYDSSDY